jgi:hypothetical protein
VFSSGIGAKEIKKVHLLSFQTAQRICAEFTIRAYERAIGAEDSAVREFLLKNAINFPSEDVEIRSPRPSPI